MKNNRFPIISNMEVLEPKIVEMRKGGTLPRHAYVWTQREWDFIQKCTHGGIEVEVILKRKLK
jgi:hypothetical protein